MPPEPRLICACTFWRPAPSGSFHGSRKVKRRARRYGDDQAAIVPRPATVANARASVGSGVPATSSIAPTMTTIVITVPRSGSTSTSTQKRPTSSPIGRARSFGVRGAGVRARYAAHQTTSASFASSDGWNVAGPKPIQRRAPFTRVPITSTARHSASADSTSIGASGRSLRKSVRAATTSSATPASAYVACRSR